MLEKFYQEMALLESRKIIYKIAIFLKSIFGEKDPGSLNFDFSNAPTRIEIVQRIIDLKNYRSYLEIGTFKDELFSKIKCEKKIGVDPFSGGNTRMTSDDFFKQNKEKFDCIFVDGLHHYDQVKKDIENSINCLNENGILLVHDCLPISISAQSIPRTEVNWNGDVWKSFVEQRTKENLDCYTIFADHGVGVILKRKNRSLLNLNIKNFKKLKFIYYYKHHQELMNIIKFNELIKII